MRKLSIFLVFVLLLLQINVFAEDYTYGYTPGPIAQTLEGKYITESEGVSQTEGYYVFAANGNALFDFYLPFNSESITFTYFALEDTTLTITTEQNTFEVSLLAAETTSTFTFPIAERKGERLFSFSADKAITISSIVFNKMITRTLAYTVLLPDLTEEEQAIETAIMMDKDASMIMVYGGRRYIDLYDAKETPYNKDGTLYLPIHVLCRAFGIYYEDMPDKNYVLLRKDPLEYCFVNDISYKQSVGGEKVNMDSPVIYINGETYLPVRFFANELGLTVGYKDGIVVIDNKFSVKNILETEELFTYVKEKFTPFHKAETEENTYYVSASRGTENGNGSIDSPFKTITEAAELADAGDTVIIEEGTYREILAPKNNGTPTNPIVFKAKEGDKVVLSATEVVSGFKKYKDTNFLCAPLSWNLGLGRNFVIYNDEAVIEARYPNGPGLHVKEDSPKLSNLFPVRGDFTVNDYVYGSDGRTNLVESSTLLNQTEKDYWKDGIYMTMHGHGYALGSAIIESSEEGKLYLKNQSTKYWFNPADSSQMDFGYITGHINALDAPGEWIIKDNQLIICPPNGETAETLKVEVKKRQIVADLENSEYVKLIGLDVVGGGMRLNNSNMCVVEGGDMKYISHFTHTMDQREGFIDGTGNHNQNISDPNGAPTRGEVGIYVGGTDNVIANNTIDHSAAAGVYITGLYAYIENNIISNCGYMGSYVSGIHVNTEGWKTKTTPRGGFAIYNNTVYNSGRSVLNICGKESWGLVPYIPYEVAYNDFHDGILFSLDTGITYEYMTSQGSDKLNSRMHNNYVYYTVNAEEQCPYSFGIYHDGGTQYIDTYENLIFTTKERTTFSTGYFIFEQPHKTATANHTIWNNSSFIEFTPGKEGLTTEQFPGGKPFYAGSTLNEPPYMLNYNNIIENKVPDYLYAKNATLSEGVTVEYDMVELKNEGDYLVFEDVDIENDSVEVNVNYKADFLNTGDEIEVYIGESLEKAFKTTLTLKTEAPDMFNSNTEKVSLHRVKPGKSNVYIVNKNHKSARIDYIYLFFRDSTEDLPEGYTAKVYGGSFNEVIKVGSNTAPTIRIDGDPINPIVYNTWTGTQLAYYNVKIAEDSNKLEFSITTGEEGKGQLVNVRIGSVTASPIATHTVNNTVWSNYGETVVVPLNETLEAGIYDIYVTFDEKEGVKKYTTNFYYMAFMK